MSHTLFNEKSLLIEDVLGENIFDKIITEDYLKLVDLHQIVGGNSSSTSNAILDTSFLLTKLLSDLNTYKTIHRRKNSDIINDFPENEKYNLDFRKIENLWKLKEQPGLSTDNLRIDNLEDTLFELDNIAFNGNNKFYLDISSPLTGRNIDGLKSIAMKLSGKINIFYCSGFTDLNLSTHNQFDEYIEELSKVMKSELTAGILFVSEGKNCYVKSCAISHQIGLPYYGNTSVNFSFRSESVFITHDLSKMDLITLSAAAKVHKEWCSNDQNNEFKQPPIIISLCPFSDKHIDVLEILIKSGGNPSRVVFCNVVISMNEVSYWDNLIRTYKCFLCIDSFGWCPTFSLLLPETSSSSSCLNVVRYPTDEELVRVVVKLCELGHSSHLLLSLSIFSKMQLQRFGGYGYSHLERVVKPRLLAAGLSIETTNRLTCLNLMELLNWRLPLQKQEVVLEKVPCYICSKLFVLGTENHYSKFSYDYCSSNCLTIHRKNNWAKKA